MKKKVLMVVAAAGAALALALAPAIANAESSDSSDKSSQQEVKAPADGTPQGAIEWYQSQDGSTEYEGMCELAAEKAYGTSGVWPSAIDHWNGAIAAGKAHEGDTNPPAGAFVYWNTSQYGHVGVADGKGGFYATSVGGKIGHGDDLGYYGNYLGWSDAQVPALTGPKVENQH
ncbi:MAG: CHAP domain-containing protein [Stackebrandtia sp.]